MYQNSLPPELTLAVAVADVSRDGVILCGADGRAFHRNPVARSLLERDPSAIQTAIEQVLSASARMGKPQRLDACGLTISATPHNSDSTGCLAIVTIVNRDCRRDPSELRTRFGLSRRESEVATLLAERLTDAEIAAALGISWHTVRSHVERVFRSLGCQNRREVANLLSGSRNPEE